MKMKACWIPQKKKKYAKNNWIENFVCLTMQARDLAATSVESNLCNLMFEMAE